MENTTFVIAGLMILAILFLMAMFAKLFRKAGPHEAIIVYGFRGTRVVKGRGTVIFPMVESARGLSLELMSFDVAPKQDLYTRQGVAVTVEAVAQIKVKSDPESILTAAEQFLTKSPDEREGLIRLVMEGHLRGIIGQLTVEEIVKQPEMVGERMRSTCADDMTKMGLEVISFTIQRGPRQERLHHQHGPAGRGADQARCRRSHRRSRPRYRHPAGRGIEGSRRGQGPGGPGAGTGRGRYRRPSRRKPSATWKSRKPPTWRLVKKQQAQADKAYDIQTNVMLQQVRAEEVTIEQVQKEHQVKVQERRKFSVASAS